jgi:hypothetical protein
MGRLPTFAERTLIALGKTDTWIECADLLGVSGVYDLNQLRDAVRLLEADGHLVDVEYEDGFTYYRLHPAVQRGR